MEKIILIIFLLLSPIVFSKNSSVERTTTEISRLFVEKTDFSKKENRKLLAIAFLKNINSLNQLIPKNTPADEAWINNEIRDSKGNTQRQLNYISTTIFSKYWLKGRLEGMIKNLNLIAYNSIPLKFEAIIWVTLGDELSSDYELINDNIKILIENHEVDPKILNGLGINYYAKECRSMYQMFGRDVLTKVVVPLVFVI